MLAVAASSTDMHRHIVEELSVALQQQLLWPRLRMLSLFNRLGIAYPNSSKLQSDMEVVCLLNAVVGASATARLSLQAHGVASNEFWLLQLCLQHDTLCA